MKKSITISIPEPCHEDWQQMTATEKGKFCAVCTKEVIDFTSKTDEDLVKIVSKGGNLCGRFKKNQLDREVKLERSSGLHLAPYAASLLLPLSLLGTSVNNNNNSDKTYTSLGIGSFSNPDRVLVHISGKVYDASGNPISNVKITALETGKFTFSDLEGNYMISTLDHDSLNFKILGFDSHEEQLGLKSEKTDIILFSESPMMPIPRIVGKFISEPVNPSARVSHEALAETQEISNKITISGTVTDDAELALPGVNIIIKGTSEGTQTDFDGNYNIEVDKNTQLQFSYLGYETKEITVSNVSNSIDIKLDESSYELLGEMVISGGVSFEEYSQNVPSLTPEVKRVQKEKQAEAYINELEYKRIKQARKKADRLKRRSKNK